MPGGPGDPPFEPLAGPVLAAEPGPGHRQEVVVEGGPEPPGRIGRPLQGLDRAGPVAGPVAGHAQGVPARRRGRPRPDRLLGQGQGAGRVAERRVGVGGQEPGQVVEGVDPAVAVVGVAGVVGREDRPRSAGRLAALLDRLGGPAGLGQGPGQAVPGDRQVGGSGRRRGLGRQLVADGQGLAEGLGRLVGPAASPGATGPARRAPRPGSAWPRRRSPAEASSMARRNSGRPRPSARPRPARRHRPGLAGSASASRRRRRTAGDRAAGPSRPPIDQRVDRVQHGVAQVVDHRQHAA